MVIEKVSADKQTFEEWFLRLEVSADANPNGAIVAVVDRYSRSVRGPDGNFKLVAHWHMPGAMLRMLCPAGGAEELDVPPPCDDILRAEVLRRLVVRLITDPR